LKLLGCPKRLDGVSWLVTEGLDLFLNPATVRSSVGLANHRTVGDDSCEMCNKSYGCKILYKPTAVYILTFFYFGCSGETEDTFIADLSVGLATVLSFFHSTFVLLLLQ